MCRAAETTVLIAEAAQSGKLLFLLSSVEGLREAPQEACANRSPPGESAQLRGQAEHSGVPAQP